MKIYRLAQLAESSPDGVCSLGAEALKTTALHLDYGKLSPGGTKSYILSLDGYDKVVFVVRGNLTVRLGEKGKAISIGAGEAFAPGDGFYLENEGGEAVDYIVVGGRAEGSSEKQPEEEEGAVERTEEAGEDVGKSEPVNETGEAGEFLITTEDTPE